MNKNTFSIGCEIDGSRENADYVNRETIEFAQSHGFEGEMPDEEKDGEDYSQFLSEMADSAVDFLNSHEDVPAYCAFYFEENCLFLAPDVESVKGSVDFVSSKEQDYPDDDFEGEWLHVNDHGNCTLYVRKDGEDKEIWSIV